MTFFKKYKGLAVGGAIAVVMILVVGVLLVRYLREYTRVQSALQSSSAQLDRLNNRSPFPSGENVELVELNLSQLEAYLQGMLDSLSAHQPTLEPMERAAFPAEIERVARRLRRVAEENEVLVAETVAFGFERYSRGNLPTREHVPRLVIQLRTIEKLSELMFQSKVSELLSVRREVFDEERVRTDESPAGRRGARTPETTVTSLPVDIDPDGVDGLYTRERYTFTFLATDAALRTVLNRLAADPMMIVVRNLDLRNEMAVGGSPAQRLAERLRPRATDARTEEGEEGRPALRPATAEDRVVAGLERIRVVMELDVYRFKQSDVEGEHL